MFSFHINLIIFCSIQFNQELLKLYNQRSCAYVWPACYVAILKTTSFSSRFLMVILRLVYSTVVFSTEHSFWRKGYSNNSTLLLDHRQNFSQTALWVTRWVSYKKQKLLTLYGPLSSPTVFRGVPCCSYS
jgi:hypothetical protein